MVDNAERITLGPTDIQVSPVGIGTWSWGDTFYWQYGRGYAEGDVRQAFQASLEGGINFFDTAEIYGSHQSEKLLGQCVRSTTVPVIVASKFMPFPWRVSRNNLAKALRASLERLGLPKIDLYQIHHPMPPIQPETWMAALVEASEAGLVGSIGVSNYSASWMRRCYVALQGRGLPLASNQVQYSLLERAPERNGVLQACRDMGATLIAYSPLAMGILTGKYTSEKGPPGPRGGMYGAKYLGRVQPLIRHLEEIGRQCGKTVAQVALNWVVCKGALPIPGAKNASQAAQNAGALGWRLTDDQVASLDEASDRVTTNG